MIGRLRGTICDRLVDGSCVIDVRGVGYECFVPLGTLGRLPAPPAEVELYVHTHVREDALLLYAFASQPDRAAFRVLLGVSSIGPKLALAILGALPALELATAIAAGDAKRFKGIPGVGKRTVERILLELKEKTHVMVGEGSLADRGSAAGTPATPAAARALGSTGGLSRELEQVEAALLSMGWKAAETRQAVTALAAEADKKSVDTLLKEALGRLG